MPDTSAQFEAVQDVIVVRVLAPEISHETGELIQTRTHEIHNGDKPMKVVLDLSKITFIGSIGLTVLVVFLKRIKTAGGRLAISGLTGQSRKVLTVTKLEKIFEFYADVDEALAALQTN